MHQFVLYHSSEQIAFSVYQVICYGNIHMWHEILRYGH